MAILRRLLFVASILIFTVSSCVAKEANNLYIVKNAKIDTFTKDLSFKLENPKIKNHVLYSDTKDFYYIKAYQDGDNLNLFLVCDNNNLEKSSASIKSLNYKIYQLADKDLTKTYTKDFNSYVVQKEAYLGNLSDEWETVEKEAMALVEYMKKQIEELLRTE